MVSYSIDANQERLQSDNTIPGGSLFANGDTEVHDDDNICGDREICFLYLRWLGSVALGKNQYGCMPVLKVQVQFC